MELKEKSVLITGGTGGLGSVLAEHFWDIGATVIVTYRGKYPQGRSSRDNGPRFIPIEADVTQEKNVAALFRKASNRVRRVDILVNAVGGYLPSRPFSKATLSDWKNLLDVNLTSAFLCTREFLRQKGIRKYGRIFNISAQTAFRPAPGKVPYAVAKAAVGALTVALAEEVKGTNITVNAFAPSILRTRGNVRSMPGEDTRLWVDPADIAAQMATLCGPRGASVNGAIIPVFGGV